MNIIYRDLKKKDYKEIKSLITDAWFKDYNYSAKIKNMYANGYLYYHLANSNYLRVATENDAAIGFLFGRCKKVSFFHKLANYTKLFFILFSFLFTKAGRRGLRIVKYESKIDKAMKKPYKKTLTNEICLFIINKDYRSFGIGSKLEESFIKFLKDNGEHHAFLYTDTYSSYQFYLNKGYKQIGESDKEFNEEFVDENQAYYLYKKEF